MGIVAWPGFRLPTARLLLAYERRG